MVQLQQYDDALNDINVAITSSCLRNGHTKNTISKAYTIKGIYRYYCISKNKSNNGRILTYSSCINCFLFLGDAFYHLGEFEKSLMFYYRALHKCQSGSECEDTRY